MLRAQEDAVNVEIPVTGFALNGELIVPPGSKGVVLFAHGSGSSRHSPRNQFVARVLRSRGMGTLLFDLLTEEEEKEDSQNGHLRFNIDLLAERLHIAAQWFYQKHSVGPVGYFGSSTGAAAALVAGAQPDVPVRGIVSRGGRPDLAGPVLPRVKAPTLLIVGSEDTVVIGLNEEAYSRLCCEKELRLVSGATHLFEEPGTLEQVAEMAADWFCRHLSAG
jgi:putative phosphoribosyl transferase